MRIKEKPEDFYVREVIDLKSKSPGAKYVYFLMRKKNISTIRAIKIVSKRLGISKRRIFFAGEKDKKTISEQYIAIENLREFKQQYDFGNVKLRYIGTFDEPLRISDIIGNEFVITIRDVTNNESEKFKRNSLIFCKGFYNYFDDQRFGNIRYINHLVGKAILKRDWEEAVKILLTYSSEEENPISKEARKWLSDNWGKFKEAIKLFPKWLDIELSILNYLAKKNNYYRALRVIHKRLLKLFIHAYQSYLWNKVLSKYIQYNASKLAIINVANESVYISKDLDFLNNLKDKILPAVGYDLNINLLDEEIKEIYKEVLIEEEISLDDMYFKDKPSLTLKSIKRKIIADVYNFNYELENRIIKLSFGLKRGSYATMFIKHLFS